MSQAGKNGNGSGGLGSVLTLTGNVGPPVPADGSGNINIVGAGGAVFTGNAGTHALTLTLPGGGYIWQVIAADQTAVTGHGYLVLKPARVLNLTLPASPLVGDSFIVADVAGGTFKLVQNPGDSIQLADLLTTVSVGSITSTKIGDSLMLVCWASGPGASWIALQPEGSFLVV